MPLLCAIALGQVVATTQSSSLKYDGHIYVPSPIFAIKPVTPDERYELSGDGSRVAYVSASSSSSPGALTSLIAGGKPTEGPIKVGIWSKDAGRAFDVFVSKSPKAGVGDFCFFGREVVFETFDPIDVGRTAYNLWIAGEGVTARQLKLEGYAGAAKFIVAPNGKSMVIASSKVWLMSSSRTMPVHLPGFNSFLCRGVSKDGRAVVFAFRKEGTGEHMLIDFETGKATVGSEDSLLGDVPPNLPFILDTFRLGGQKSAGMTEDARAERVDSKMSVIASEDGGHRLDLVEAEGEKRSRIPFIHEMADSVRVSQDGLTYVFVSNKTLMARWMIKLDPEAEKLRKG